jgi:DNA-binding transcriptional LysR family regulator
MELRHLQTFQTVLKRGSFAAAARALDVAQSTVTLHIQQLEASLGVTLFERGTRQPRLTEAGRTLNDHAGSILARVETLRETMAELTDGERGDLRIGAIDPVASRRLPPILVRFSRERPKVRLTIDVGGAEPLALRVVRGELDLAISSPPPAGLPLSFQPLYREPMALLVPASFDGGAGGPVTPAIVCGQRLLVTESSCAYRALTERVLRDGGAQPERTVEINSIEALAWAVQAGLGVAVVPEISATPPPPGTILRRFAGAEIGLTVGLALPVDAPAPGRALTALLTALRGHLARSFTASISPSKT